MPVDGAAPFAFREHFADSAPPRTLDRALAVEAPVAIEINGIGYAVMMATPTDLADYALGFCLSEQLIDSAATMGDSHLRLSFRSPGGPSLEAVAWGAMNGPLGPALIGAKGRRFHLAGKLELSTWGGRERLRLRLDDAAPV